MDPCAFCRAECCKTYVITTTPFDILRICENTGKKAEDFTILHEPRLLGFDPDTVLETKDGYGRYLLGIRSHPCFFLKNNRCTVHNFAPLSCRRYPFTLSDSFNGRFCHPVSDILLRIKGPEIAVDELKRELEVYKKIINEWNKKSGKKEDCIRFLLQKAESRR